MSTRNDRFNRSVRSIELALTGLRDTSKTGMLSDNGAGAERIYDGAEDTGPLPSKADVDRDRSTMIDICRALLILDDLGHLAGTLALIFENGAFGRKRSIAALCRDRRKKACLRASKRRYERNRKALLELFTSLSVHGYIEGHV